MLTNVLKYKLMMTDMNSAMRGDWFGEKGNQ